MARLTILQASQQGFANTLTIHRCIKDGHLPVHEEGDTKLLEVDDLVGVFGEPGGGATAADETAPANTNLTGNTVDIGEFNRLKAELDQKNKKNMWLAADMAEVVRELKEKEARFDKERNRLLTVLEQAQALLLREAEKVPATNRTALNEQEANTVNTVALPPETAEPQLTTVDGSANETSKTSKPAEFPFVQSKDAPPKPAESEAGGTDEIETVSDEKEDGAIPGDKVDGNPLAPPLPAEEEIPAGHRVLRTSTWLLLAALVAGAFVLFQYRTVVLANVAKIIEAIP